jgi:hypothetical protein
MPASGHVTVGGMEAGKTFSRREIAWFCSNKDCRYFEQQITPTWVNVGAFLSFDTPSEPPSRGSAR